MPRSITIALAQLATEPTKAEALDKTRSYVAESAAAGADLVVLPDLSYLQFFPQHRTQSTWMEQAESVPGGPSCEATCELAKEHGVAILASIYEAARAGVYYDAAVGISNQGEVVGIQRMMHIPEEPDFNEKFYYKPGNSDYPVFELAGTHIGVALGQDLFYPEHHRLLAIHGAEVILAPNAIAAETDPLVLCSRAAAVMNHVYVGVANRVGKDGALEFIGRSHFSSPDGSVLSQSEADQEQLVLQELDLDALASTRREQNYWLRDRRPETYSDLTRDLV